MVLTAGRWAADDFEISGCPGKGVEQRAMPVVRPGGVSAVRPLSTIDSSALYCPGAVAMRRLW